MKKLNLICLLFMTTTASFARYPVIPKSWQAVKDAQKEEWQKASDQAFLKALPIIMYEAENQHRPYVPWASKPDDLI